MTQGTDKRSPIHLSPRTDHLSIPFNQIRKQNTKALRNVSPRISLGMIFYYVTSELFLTVMKASAILFLPQHPNRAKIVYCHRLTFLFLKSLPIMNKYSQQQQFPQTTHSKPKARINLIQIRDVAEQGKNDIVRRFPHSFSQCTSRR